MRPASLLLPQSRHTHLHFLFSNNFFFLFEFQVRKSLETLSVLIHNKDAPSLTDYSYMSGSPDEPLDGTTFDRSKG